MELKEFVDALPLSTFNELRRVVIEKHQRHSEEVVVAIQYLSAQESLIAAIDKNRPACVKVLAEKCNIQTQIADKAISRFVEMQDAQVKTSHNQTETPFK